MSRSVVCFLSLGWILCLGSVWPVRAEGDWPPFTGHSDVGRVHKGGAVMVDLVPRTYRVGGGGSNRWFGTDAFHFVWTQVAGDVCLAEDFPGFLINSK